VEGGGRGKKQLSSKIGGTGKKQPASKVISFSNQSMSSSLFANLKAQNSQGNSSRVLFCSNKITE
jgi:hypothetical protein